MQLEIEMLKVYFDTDIKLIHVVKNIFCCYFTFIIGLSKRIFLYTVAKV